VMEMHSTDALNSSVKRLMHVISAEDNDTQQNAAPQMIQIPTPWMIRRWSELKHTNKKPLVRIQKENEHLVDLEWTEDEQAKLETLVERFTSRGASGAWRAHRWQLVCSSLVLRDTEDWDEVSGQWYDELALDTWVDSLIFQLLRVTFLPMLVKE